MSDNETKCPNVTVHHPFVDEERNTMLHVHASVGNVDEVTKELDNGSKVDPLNSLGWSPLMMAARNGHFETVKLLVQRKADTTKKNGFGSSVFIMSVANGNMEMIEFILQHLLSGGVSKQSMESTISPISVAILFDHNDIIQSFISKRFNLNATNVFTGVTPLMYAAVMKNTEMFNILISSGANIHQKNINSLTAQDISTAMETNKQQLAAFYTKYQERQEEAVQQVQQCQPQPQQQTPQIFLEQVPQFQPPQYYPAATVRPMLSPAPTFLNLPGQSIVLGMSSNVSTPISAPLISPIVKDCHGQMFFPPNFNMNQVLSPLNYMTYDNSMLNHNIYSPMISPMSPMIIPNFMFNVQQE